MVSQVVGPAGRSLHAGAGIPIQSTGATTLKAQLKERGLEPDQSYYITNESLVRGCDDLDLEHDPPPDLAIEVEISRSALDKLAIYGDLGVSEVWLMTETRYGCMFCNPTEATTRRHAVPCCRN